MYKSQNTKSEITLLHLESSFWGCQKWSLLLFSLYLLCCYTLLSVCVGHAAFILMVRSLVLVHLLKKNAGFTFFLGFTHLIRGSPVVWLSKSVFEVSTFLQCAYVIVSVMSPVNSYKHSLKITVYRIKLYFILCFKLCLWVLLLCSLLDKLWCSTVQHAINIQEAVQPQLCGSWYMLWLCEYM